MGWSTSEWTRRGVLAGALGSATALAGCGGSSSDPRSGTTSRPTPGTTTTAASSRPRWSRLAKHVDGDLVLPRDADYATARLLQNPRFDDLRPQALLRVAGPDDVATAFAFAQDAGLPVAIRSGGHCYSGWSAGGDPPALVIDCRGLASTELHDDGSASIGPGAALVEVYDALGSRGRAVPAGSCPTVGFGGLALGGGVGVLTRALGLTCDVVTSLEIVTADRRVRTVDAEHDPDLYWACRGGGGGHVGVVTGFTVATSAAPVISTLYGQWSLDDAADVVAAWQDWIADADPRLWSTMKLLGGTAHPDGPVVEVAATWAGADRPAQRAFDRLVAALPAPQDDVRHRRDYRDTMLAYAGCLGLPVSACTTAAGGRLTREAFAATSHVAGRPLDDHEVPTLVEHVRAAQASGLTEAGVSVDALGGRAGEPGPGDTAFVHRTALATVQYTATYDDPTQSETADRLVHGFRAALVPAWGETAYVNYTDATLPDPAAAYFGDNAPRLAQVRATYDPDGFFTQPQDW